MACAICKTRREKRHCPGVQGEICAICCGEQREETVDCPLDCEYLQIGHQHEALAKKDPAGVPNPEVRISREFLKKNVELVMALQHAIVVAAVERNAIDYDVKEALDGLTRTYKTLDSGLYYESRPSNPMAAAIFDAIQQRVAEIRKAEEERGVHKLLNSQVFTILVLLQHMEYAFNNGRKRGRCFLENLVTTMADVAQSQPPGPTSSLLVS
jgi:hypothetical protein